MELFVQRVIDGLASGSTYAALGLALVLIFRTTAIFNFAQGEMAVFTAFFTWWLSTSPQGPGIPLGLAVVVALVASFLGGALIERTVIRPIEGSDNHLVPVVVAIALFVSIDAVIGKLFGTETRRMPSLFPDGNVTMGSVVVAKSTIGLFVVLGALCGSLWLLLHRTRVGLAMRAVASNSESSGLTGVPVDRLLMFGWGLAAVVGGIAGILVAPRLFLGTTMMQGVLIYAFAGVAIGGLDSLVGAIVGGLGVGVLESLVGGYVDFVGSQLKLSFALMVLVGFLIVRPTGLFGRKAIVRV